MSKSISTFRFKWKTVKDQADPEVMKLVDFSKGLGPALDDLEKALFKAASADTLTPDLKKKLEKAAATVYKKIEAYVGMIKKGNAARPECGKDWYMLHEALRSFDKLYEEETRIAKYGIEPPAVEWLSKSVFKKDVPQVEHEDRTKPRKTGFDLSRNTVHDRNKQGPNQPAGKDAMPERGILKKPGEIRPRVERPDREGPTEEEVYEDSQKGYQRYVQSLAAYDTPDQAFGEWNKKKAMAWLPNHVKVAIEAGGAANLAKTAYTSFLSGLSADPFDLKETTQRYENVKRRVTDLGNVFPDDADVVRKALAKVIENARILLAARTRQVDS